MAFQFCLCQFWVLALNVYKWCSCIAQGFASEVLLPLLKFYKKNNGALGFLQNENSSSEKALKVEALIERIVSTSYVKFRKENDGAIRFSLK